MGPADGKAEHWGGAARLHAHLRTLGSGRDGPAPSCPSQMAFNRVTLLGTHSCPGEGHGAGGGVRPAARGALAEEKR